MDLILQEVTNRDDLKELKDELLLQLPESEFVSRLIGMKIRYPLKINVYRHRASNGISDLVIVTGTPSSKTLPSINLFWRDEELAEEDAASLLETLPKWNWKGAMCLHCITDKYFEKVKRLAQHKKLIGNSLSIAEVIPQYSFNLKNEKVEALTEPSLPLGFKFGTIHPHQLQSFFEVCERTLLLDLKTFQENVTILPTVAVYKDEDENESLPISWMCLHDFGYMGFTYTHPDYRRMGFSTHVLTKLSKLVAEKGHDVSLIASDENKGAVAHYRKFGFEEGFHCSCIFFLPKNKQLKDYDYNNIKNQNIIPESVI